MARPGHRKISTTLREGAPAAKRGRDPRFNTALARGLAILRAFELEDLYLGNAEIAERTRIPKPTISRLTFTLAELGYLKYRDEIGKYELAPGILALGYAYLGRMLVPTVARPHMLELARALSANVGLGIRDGLSVIYLEYALGEPHMNPRQRVGFRLPLARTATGRACIAALHAEERDRILEQIRQANPKDWPALRDQIGDAVAQVRRHGYCMVLGTHNSMTNTVAVPFPHPDGRQILAFNCGGHVQIHTPDKLAKAGERLLQLVRAVRRELTEVPVTVAARRR